MPVAERKAEIRQMACGGSCYLGFDIMTNDPWRNIQSFIWDVTLGWILDVFAAKFKLKS